RGLRAVAVRSGHQHEDRVAHVARDERVLLATRAGDAPAAVALRVTAHPLVLERRRAVPPATVPGGQRLPDDRVAADRGWRRRLGGCRQRRTGAGERDRGDAYHCLEKPAHLLLLRVVNSALTDASGTDVFPAPRA